MMKTYWVAALAFVLSVPGSLMAQTAAVRIEAARQRVVSNGLPVTLLDQRIAEGRAKGVAEERIAEAIERRANALLQAGNALRPAVVRPSEAELAAGADAVEAGIPADALRRLIARARADDRAVALAVLTFLHRERGLPIETALERVSEAAARGPGALRDLPVRTAATRTGRPAAAGTGNAATTGRSRVPGERPSGVRPGGATPEPERPSDQGAGRRP